MQKSFFSGLLLFFLAHLSQAQPTIFVTAPPANSYGQGTLPNGSQSSAIVKGCYLINQSELGGLLSSDITSFGFELYGGTAAVSGNFTVYLENTVDLTYSKSASYTAAISGMSNVYAGAYTIPAYSGATDMVTLNFPSNFSYAGGNLYVAFSWSATTPPIPYTGYYAAYYANSASNSAIKGGYSWSAGSNPLLQTSTERPVCIFGALNNATNEAAVISVSSPGKVAEILHTHHTISAEIQNKSINTLSNISVSLSVSGDNSFTDTQVIPSLGPGDFTTVVFADFEPTVLGNNYITVSLPDDQYFGNNQLDNEQVVTCHNARNGPPAATFTQSIGYGNFSGTSLSLFNFNKDATLTGVKMAIGADYATTNAELYGIVIDESGVVLGTTNSITPNTGMFNSIQSFSFSNPAYLLAGTNYYIGMAQSKGFYTAANETKTIKGLFYYSNIDGSNIESDDTYYLGIEPVLNGTDIMITQNSTVMCTGESKLLMASGATNYTWTSSVFNPIDNPNDPTIEVAPTSNEMYTLTALDDAGCSATLTTPVAVKACVGLKENTANQNLIIYPNPALNGQSSISGLSGENTIAIYNIMGEEIYKEKTSEEIFEINLKDYPAGNYLVKISAQKLNFTTLKVINIK